MSPLRRLFSYTFRFKFSFIFSIFGFVLFASADIAAVEWIRRIIGYINSDEEIMEIEKKIVYYETVVEFIDGVIKSIDSRGWDIRNAQDWKKFIAGGF